MKITNIEKIEPRIYCATWQSIYKLPAQWFSKFGCVVGDEAHNFKAKSLISILTKCSEAEYRFGTTGTLDGTNTHKLVLEGVFGPVYHVTTTKELMDEGSLAKLNINVLLLKYPDALCKELKGAKYQEEIDFLVSNEARNKFIRNLTLDQTGNTLVLFQYVEKHGKPLHDLIRKGADENRHVFFVSGGTDVEGRERVRQITDQHDNHKYTFITLENTKYKTPNDLSVILNDGTSKKAVNITTNDDISESFISSVLRKYKYQ